MTKFLMRDPLKDVHPNNTVAYIDGICTAVAIYWTVKLVKNVATYWTQPDQQDEI